MKPAFHLALAAVFIAIIGVTLWMARDVETNPAALIDQAPPAPRQFEVPAFDGLTDLDPLVKRLIEQRVAELRMDQGAADRWAALGHACHANGLLEAAAQCYQTAIAIEPSNARWEYLRALLWADQHNLDAAIAGMNRVLALDSTYVATYWRLGFWHLQRDELNEAETTLSLASRMEEGHVVPLIGLAQLAKRHGQTSDVIVWLEPLIAELPDTPYARHLLAEAYEQSDRAAEAALMREGANDQMPRWHDEWEYAIEEARTGREHVLERARRDLDAERVKPAYQALMDARTYWPDDSALLALLGEAQFAQGDAAMAVSNLRAAVDGIALPDVRTLMALGRAHLTLEQWSEAAVVLDRAAHLEPPDGDRFLLLVQPLMRLGRRDEAIAALAEAKRLGTDDPALMEMLELLTASRSDDP